MLLKDHSYSAYLEQTLTKEEIEDPHQVITDFFEQYDLCELRKFIWLLRAATITGGFNSEELTEKERHTMMRFYDQITRLVEADHVLYERREEKVR